GGSVPFPGPAARCAPPATPVSIRHGWDSWMKRTRDTLLSPARHEHANARTLRRTGTGALDSLAAGLARRPCSHRAKQRGLPAWTGPLQLAGGLGFEPR